jgi:hypothetical protein
VKDGHRGVGRVEFSGGAKFVDLKERILEFLVRRKI